MTNVSGRDATSESRSSFGKANPIIVSSRLNARNTMRPTRNLTRSRTTTSYARSSRLTICRTSSMVTATWVRLRAVTATWNHDGGLHEIPLDAVPGRLWLCGKHMIGPDPEAVLARTGAHTVVCLTERHELADRYPHYVRWLDEHHSADAEGRALWFPVHDL